MGIMIQGQWMEELFKGSEVVYCEYETQLQRLEKLICFRPSLTTAVVRLDWTNSSRDQLSWCGEGGGVQESTCSEKITKRWLNTLPLTQSSCTTRSVSQTDVCRCVRVRPVLLVWHMKCPFMLKTKTTSEGKIVYSFFSWRWDKRLAVRRGPL